MYQAGISFALDMVLAIAAASVSGKSMMVFDEPTSGLDYGNMCQVSQLIRKLAADKIVLIATHDRELVNRKNWGFGTDRYSLSVMAHKLREQ